MDYTAVLALDPPENSMRARWQEVKPRVAIVGSHSSQLTQTGEMLQELITPLELHYAGCGYREPICKELDSDPNSDLANGIWYVDKERITRGMLADRIPGYDLVIVIDVGLSRLLRQLSQEVPILHVIGLYPLTELAADISEEALNIQKHIQWRLQGFVHCTLLG